MRISACVLVSLLGGGISDDADIIVAPEESDFIQQAEEEEKKSEEAESNDGSGTTGVIDDSNASFTSPKTLIYVCEGTARPISFCQFPFTTLAGNEYTSSCADKVEDNPDYSVDRPWCFTSATEWGFCDCQAFFDYTYVVSHNPTNNSLRDLTAQIKISYPGTVWCALWTNSSFSPPLSDVTSGAIVGGSIEITRDMLLQDIDGQVDFSASLDQMKSPLYLSCQANIPGLPSNPNPVVTLLGTKKDMLDDPSDAADPGPIKPRLVTRTSGALMYSTLICLTLAGFFFYRYAMDRRDHLLKFTRISQEETIRKPFTKTSP
jgi:hypothetical protein